MTSMQQALCISFLQFALAAAARAGGNGFVGPSVVVEPIGPKQFRQTAGDSSSITRHEAHVGR